MFFPFIWYNRTQAQHCHPSLHLWSLVVISNSDVSACALIPEGQTAFTHSGKKKLYFMNKLHEYLLRSIRHGQFCTLAWVNLRLGHAQSKWEPRGLSLPPPPLRPPCTIPHCSTCRSHSNKDLCLTVVCYYRLNAPCTCTHAHAQALTCNASPTPHPTPSIPYAQLSLHLASTADPLPAPPSFHNIRGSSIPSAPSPLKCTQLNAHSATPTSLPDNTTAWPSHNIHAHAPHTFMHSSAFSPLLAEMPEQCKGARARQSAMIIPSTLRLLRQVASSGNGNRNKVNEGESKRWWTTFLSHNDLGQKMRAWCPEPAWGNKASHPALVSISGQSTVSLAVPHLSEDSLKVCRCLPL